MSKQDEAFKLFDDGFDKKVVKAKLGITSVTVTSYLSRWRKLHGIDPDEANKNNVQPPATSGKGRTVALATTQTRAGVVTFKIKDEDITLNADDLYESYFFYLDMKARDDVTNPFSDFLKAGAEVLWSLSHKPIIENEEVKIV